MRKLVYFTVGIVLVMSLACPALAVEVRTEQEQSAAYLKEKGIMLGDSNGDMMLDKGLTRAQMAALLTRIVANPEHIEADSAFYRSQCSFSDVPEWAKVYVGYCAANHLVSGYGNGLYGPNDPVTSAAACTVMLRCLEDVDDDWNYSTACQTAVKLGLAPAEALTETEITRGNMAILIYRTMAQMGSYVESVKTTETDKPFAVGVPEFVQVNPTESAQTVTKSETDFDTLRTEIVERVNAVRMENGAAPLTVDRSLMDAAQACSEKQFTSHNNRVECETVVACGYPHGFGSNLTVMVGVAPAAIPERAVANWQNSPGHLQTMIDPDCDSIGVGITIDSGRAFCYLFVGNPNFCNPYS